MNSQRSVVYGYRNDVLNTEDPHSLVVEIIEDAMPAVLRDSVDPETGEMDTDAALLAFNTHFPLALDEGKAQLKTRNAE